MRVSFRHGPPRSSLLGWALLCLVTTHSWTNPSHAEPSPSRSALYVQDPAHKRGKGDGLYGRMRGDLSYRFELGTLYDFETKTFRPRALAQLSAYQTVGLYAALSQSVAARDPIERSLSLGVTFTPLFLWRWSTARQIGSAFWDLLIDSLGVGAGVVLTEPRGGTFAQEPGFEVGLVCGVPLFARANGLWLRFRGDAATGRPPIADQDRVEGTFSMTLAWEGFFFAGLLKVD